MGLVGFSWAVDSKVEMPIKHYALLENYCIDCHNSETQKGKVDLESLSFKVTTIQQAELWQKVLNAMNAGEMPPENKRQPQNQEKTDFLDDLAQTMVLARKKLSDSGGEQIMRRLNRREYRNTIESLTGVSLNVESLPSDGGTGTFDTVGASQYISPDQFEQYLKLGRSAIDEAFERQKISSSPTITLRVDPENHVNKADLKSLKQLNEEYQRFIGWKKEVDKVLNDPKNKAIVTKILKENPKLDLSAFPSDSALKFYHHANRLIGMPNPKKYGFKDHNDAVFTVQNGYSRKFSYLKHYSKLPGNDRGAYLKLAWGIQRFDIKPKTKLVPGTYKLRINAGAVEGSPLSRRFIEIGHPQRGQVEFSGRPISSHQVIGTVKQPQIIETLVEVGIDTKSGFAIQEKQPLDRNAVRDEFDRAKRANGYGIKPAIWVDWMELEGPIKETAIQTFRVEPENTVNVRSAQAMKQMEEVQQRYLGWKAGVDKAALAPANQKALEQIRKKYKLTDLTNNLRLYQNANLLKGIPDPKKFGFKDANAASFSYQSGYGRVYPYLKHYAELPLSDRGTYLKLGWGIQRIDVTPPKDKLLPGTYRLRIRAGSVKDSDPKRHFIQIGHPQRLNGVMAGFVGKPISSHQVNGTTENPEIIETTVKIGANTPREFGIQERQPEDRNLHRKEFFRIKQENGYGYPPAVWVDWIELEGPIQKQQNPESVITRVEPEKTINPANEKFIKQTKERQERFKKWKKAVDEASKTPENQAIIAEIRKTDRLIDHPNRFYTYADRLKGTPSPKDFGFIDANKAAGSDPSRSRNLALHEHYASLPHRDTGTYLKLTHGTGRVIVAPKKMPVGSYVLRVRVGTVKGTPTARRFIEVGHPQRAIASRDWGLEGRSISAHQVTGTVAEPQIIEIPIDVRSDTIREFAVQEKQPNTGKLKVLWDEHNNFKKENGYGHPPAIWIDWVELEGPNQPDQLKTWKQRREVEHHANAKVRRKYENYFKAGYEAALAFQKDGIPRPEVGVKDLNEAKFRIRRYEMEAPSQLRYLNDPLTKNGSLIGVFDRNGNLNSEEIIELSLNPPGVKKKSKPLPLGKYRIRIRMGSIDGTPQDRHFAVLGSVREDDEFSLLNTFQVTGTTDDPQVFETTVELSLNGPRKFSLREKSNLKADHIRGKWEIYKDGMAAPPALWVDWVEWEGPLHSENTISGLASILTKNRYGDEGNEEARARNILHQFCVEAFRQIHPDPRFIDQLTGLFNTRKAAGDPFDVAIRTPLSVILASPGFLYLDEPNTTKSKRLISDRELAVRLSYFLWSAPPDEELLALAEKNILHNPATLRQQVIRLLADPRSDEFVSGFVHQWLHMERLDFFQFDTKLHREFDESVRASARREVYESFAHLLRDRESGQIGKLLKSDYVFINGLLANYYGIEGVTGEEFRKVKLPAGSPRGGLLGTAAIHAMGSDGVESSPVERGAWVLRYLLNDPPPPAPPNVPQLSRLADKPITTRERLRIHQEEAQCASCHRKIDPIGFGLENFDAAGKWRTTEVHRIKNRRNWKTTKTWEIDSSGTFHNGPSFADYFELRDRIADRESDFARGFTEALIAYSLGRPFGFTDEELAQEILATASKEKNSVSEFVHALIQSKTFRTK